MKKTIHIGCSSFNNAYWKDTFYPEDLARSKWFDFYAQHFDTYELNATFYRVPTAKSLKSWYDKSSENFLFSVKAHQTITHFKRFLDCETEIANFYELCRTNLKEKLGCVLFQLPPSFSYTAERLALILCQLNPHFDNVIEFRHRSWWIQEVYQALTKANVTFCTPSYPKLPDTLVPTSNVGYVRLHGVPKLFYSGYSIDYLQNLLAEIQQQQQWSQVFVYFNNTARKEGIENAVGLSSENLK